VQAVQTFHSLRHSAAITGGAFVANLSVCYFLWVTNGMGSGTSVKTFDAEP